MVKKQSKPVVSGQKTCGQAGGSHGTCKETKNLNRETGRCRKHPPNKAESQNLHFGKLGAGVSEGVIKVKPLKRISEARKERKDRRGK